MGFVQHTDGYCTKCGSHSQVFCDHCGLYVCDDCQIEQEVEGTFLKTFVFCPDCVGKKPVNPFRMFQASVFS